MHRHLRLIIAVLAVAHVAHAEEWTKTYTIATRPELRVDTDDVNLRVDTWDQATIEARLTTGNLKIGDGGVRIVEHQDGDAVELQVHLAHRYHVCIVCVNVHSSRVDLEIHMPREGRVNLHTADGSIALSNFKGDMELDSGDGALEIDSVDGSLRSHTGDGRIHARGRFDSLQLSSGDGRVETEVLPGSAVRSAWDVHTGDGSISLTLPDSFAADIELRTGDGRITLDMPVTVEGRLSRSDIRGKLNGGGNLLSVRTGDGSIHLGKS